MGFAKCFWIFFISEAIVLLILECPALRILSGKVGLHRVVPLREMRDDHFCHDHAALVYCCPLTVSDVIGRSFLLYPAEEAIGIQN